MSNWSLADLVDLEVLQDKLPLWKNAWREGVRDDVEEAQTNSEKERRRLGLRAMLEVVRDQEAEMSGQRVWSGARFVEWVVFGVMLVMGCGVVRGLLTTFSDHGAQAGEVRGFNVWVFLMVTLGVQWLFLGASALGFVFCKKWLGHLGVFQSLLSSGIGKLAGGVRVRIGQLVWGWRLTRILQAGGVGYNLGLLAGLFGCLWFLQVSFFWETSLPQFGEESLHRVTRVLSIPVGGEGLSRDEIRWTQLGGSSKPSDDNMIHSLSPRMQADLAWGVFFFLVLTIWGLCPRILLWFGGWWMERRALAGLDFQESHHRCLWREVTRVERGVVSSQPADGVVVLDLGGIEMETGAMRPYFLRVLRANPEARFTLGTLDLEGETKALDAARNAAMGVVFVVEGWNLSPKQMTLYHQRVRQAIGAEHLIRYVVLGSGEEMAQWSKYVDGLMDSETEIYRYE